MSPSSPAGSSSSSLPDSNVLLALPDGPVPAGHADLTSPLISLIGGYPSFPPIEGIPGSVTCSLCQKPIPLLVQVYCPPEGGTNDRTVYVFACARPSCQRKDGSVRAFRASKRNEEYVRDVEERRAREEAERAAERERARQNPFSMNGSAATGGLFGSSQPLFGGPSPVPATQTPPDISSLSISSPQPVASSSKSLAPPFPAYQPPQYLSTIGEYLAPPSMEVDSDSEDEDDNADPSWKDEQWERLLRKGVDEVFDKYVRRLEAAEDGRSQVLRYELGGCPLPYSGQSDLFKKLFPKAPIPSRPEDEDDLDLTAYYDPSPVPRCACGAKRVFELQLVPSLISILSPDSLSITGERSKSRSKTKQTEDERKKELARLAAGEAGQVEGEASEMEWGSVLVFGCEADCEGWKEEWVGVEWEGALSLGPLPEAQQQSLASIVQASA